MSGRKSTRYASLVFPTRCVEVSWWVLGVDLQFWDFAHVSRNAHAECIARLSHGVSAGEQAGVPSHELRSHERMQFHDFSARSDQILESIACRSVQIADVDVHRVGLVVSVFREGNMRTQNAIPRITMSGVSVETKVQKSGYTVHKTSMLLCLA